jgi:L-alanine-DL-glutamate epimerase-like enolase superfamily enzyme
MAAMQKFTEFDAYRSEEPARPDKLLGSARIRPAIRPIRVSTGKHSQKQIIFKQLLKASAIDICQINVTHLGGLKETIPILQWLRQPTRNLIWDPFAAAMSLDAVQAASLFLLIVKII